jgi:hypothetical protein
MVASRFARRSNDAAPNDAATCDDGSRGEPAQSLRSQGWFFLVSVQLTRWSYVQMFAKAANYDLP